MPRTRRVNPICWVHDEPREGCPDCEAEQAWERTPAENCAVDPGAASAPQAVIRAPESSSSDLVIGLRALIAQNQHRISELAATAAERAHDWYFDAAENIDSIGPNGHSQPWETCSHPDCVLAHQLDAIDWPDSRVAASRPGRETA